MKFGCGSKQSNISRASNEPLIALLLVYLSAIQPISSIIIFGILVVYLYRIN